MEIKDITVVICCAGMGTRLGIGSTKALIKIQNKSIIQRQMEILEKFDDVRIVIGYQADRVIEEVNKIRNDVMFAFNYDFQNTGVADSLRKGLIGVRKYTLYLDGDILINEEDFDKIINSDVECVAFNEYISDEPIMVKVKNDVATAFLKNSTYSWPGIALMTTDKFMADGKNVYDVIAHFLPLKAIKVRAREIDTVDDYENAVVWVENGCTD